MRFVDVDGCEPDPEWCERAARVLEQLKAARCADERNQLIDYNRRLWGELKDWLLERSHGKCWFSEARDCFSYLQVEHFRPKRSAKDLDGTEHEGYWWLAVDWRNFRVCGGVGNTKKGTFFPLRSGCRRAGDPHADLRLEDPLLLDPRDPHDPTLLTFDVEGHAKPAPHLPVGWERDRADYSINRMNLDFPPLMDKRKLVWNECWRRICVYLDELAQTVADPTNPVARTEVRNASREIRSMLAEDKELSAVARACIIGSADPRVLALLG
jgi:hypothetical protein